MLPAHWLMIQPDYLYRVAQLIQLVERYLLLMVRSKGGAVLFSP